MYFLKLSFNTQDITTLFLLNKNTVNKAEGPFYSRLVISLLSVVSPYPVPLQFPLKWLLWSLPDHLYALLLSTLCGPWTSNVSGLSRAGQKCKITGTTVNLFNQNLHFFFYMKVHNSSIYNSKKNRNKCGISDNGMPLWRIYGNIYICQPESAF